MQRLLLKTLTTTLLFSAVSQAQAGDVLTGDTRLACEAILCLSSSAKPSECVPALSRYFGIEFKKPWKTIQARINFLNLCPVSSAPNMPSLIEAIAHGEGKCDAEFLNKYNRKIAYRTKCTRDIAVSWDKDRETCSTTQVSVISDSKPAYCAVYENHEYTDLNTKYVGDVFTGGFWADGKDYDAALQRYNDNYQAIPSGVTYRLYNPNDDREQMN